MGPLTSVDDVKMQQIKALQAAANLNLKRTKFHLELVSPSSGSQNVRSELSEVVFAFSNVSIAEGAPTPENPILMNYIVEQARFFAEQSENAGQKTNFTDGNANPSTNFTKATFAYKKNMWLKLDEVKDGGKLGLVTQHSLKLENLWFSMEKELFKIHIAFNLTKGLKYDHTYKLELSDAAFQGLNRPDLRLSDWRFSTETKPDDPGANTNVEVSRVQVYGIGVFMLDVGGVDLRKGLFNADLQLFLLKYYLDFDNVETARREAMYANRTCKDAQHGERFQYLHDESSDSLLSKFNFINTATKTVPELVFAHEGLEAFDHYRVRSSWTFSPKVANYPFQDQDMVIQLEIAGQSVTREPTAVLCVLETFSGFAQNLSSLSLVEADTRIGHATYTSSFTVSEQRRWPPLSGNFKPPYRFPHDANVARQPMRGSSRLHWIISLHRPPIIGALELAPALFVAASALVSYFLPVSELRSRLTTCTTSLLAAVVQHSSLRSRIPERAAVTNADLAMLVVYTLILLSVVSTVIVLVAIHHRRWSIFAERINTMLRTFGIMSPLLFLVFPLGGSRDVSTWFATLFSIALGTYFLHACIWGGANNSLLIRDGISSCNVWLRRLCRRSPNVDYNYAPLNVLKNMEVNMWTATEVAIWIETLILPSSTEADRKRYADAFFAERIDGPVLHRLDLSAVRSLRIPLGHSMRIHDAIADLMREQQNHASQSVTTSIDEDDIDAEDTGEDQLVEIRNLQARSRERINSSNGVEMIIR